jgi:hypothetical protein
LVPDVVAVFVRRVDTGPAFFQLRFTEDVVQ